MTLKNGVVAGHDPSFSDFQCPICGSWKWGTAFKADMKTENATGHCNGWHEGRPCSFEWNRREDAWVFVPKNPQAPDWFTNFMEETKPQNSAGGENGR